MQKGLSLAILTVLLSTTCANAQIVDKKARPVSGITPPITQSELGSDMEIDNKGFNLKSVTEAFDTSSVKDNVKHYTFSANEAIKIRTRVNMSTLIVLPDWEIIDAFTIGDATTYEVNFVDVDKFPNMIKVQGLVAGSDTNFQMVGVSGNIYNFYIRTDPVDTDQVPDFNVFVDATPPANIGLLRMESEGLVGMKPPPPLPVATLEDFRMDRADYLKTLPPTETINADYRIVGDLDIAPRGVFDDGEWTYFDFRKAPTSDRTPVVMKVVDGYDSLVNTRWENGFLVAETTSSEGWTLKNGHKYVCVKKRL